MRLGPFLSGRPVPSLLARIERLELRTLFVAYGKALINDKRVDNWKTVVEIGGISLSSTGWYLGLAFLEPVTIGLSVAAAIRNGLQERGWKFRKMQLKEMSDWISELVV